MNQMNPSGQQPIIAPQQFPVQQAKKSTGKKIKEFFVGGPGTMQILPTQTPAQQQLSSVNLQNVLQMLQGGMGSTAQNQPGRFDFGPIEQRARNQFQTETIPSIAERFTALGGGQNSSAFQSVLGRAGADLESQLAALGSQVGMQQQQFGQQQQGMDRDYLLALLRLALLPQFETQYIPGKSGVFGGAAQGLGQGAGAFAAQGAKLAANAAFGLI